MVEVSLEEKVKILLEAWQGEIKGLMQEKFLKFSTLSFKNSFFKDSIISSLSIQFFEKNFCKFTLFKIKLNP